MIYPRLELAGNPWNLHWPTISYNILSQSITSKTAAEDSCWLLSTGAVIKNTNYLDSWAFQISPHLHPLVVHHLKKALGPRLRQASAWPALAKAQAVIEMSMKRPELPVATNHDQPKHWVLHKKNLQVFLRSSFLVISYKKDYKMNQNDLIMVNQTSLRYFASTKPATGNRVGAGGDWKMIHVHIRRCCPLPCSRGAYVCTTKKNRPWNIYRGKLKQL